MMDGRQKLGVGSKGNETHRGHSVTVVHKTQLYITQKTVFATSVIGENSNLLKIPSNLTLVAC